MQDCLIFLRVVYVLKTDNGMQPVTCRSASIALFLSVTSLHYKLHYLLTDNSGH